MKKAILFYVTFLSLNAFAEPFAIGHRWIYKTQFDSVFIEMYCHGYNEALGYKLDVWPIVIGTPFKPPYGLNDFYISPKDHKIFYYNTFGLEYGARLIADFSLSESDSFYYNPQNDGWSYSKPQYVKLISKDSTVYAMGQEFTPCYVFSNGLIYHHRIGFLAFDVNYGNYLNGTWPHADEFGGRIQELIYCEVPWIYGTYPQITSIENVKEQLPNSFPLYPVYPNPFNSSTRVGFELEKPAQVTLSVFDLGGRQIKTLARSLFNQGAHQITWDGQNDNDVNVPSGVYLVRMETEGITQTQKSVLVR